MYKRQVKKYINDADAKSIKSVKIEGRTLKFYKVEEPIGEDVLPAYSITIPETDLTEVNKAIKAVKDVVDKLDGEDTVEGSVKAQIKALKTEIEGKITASEYNDTEIKKSIKTAIESMVRKLGIISGVTRVHPHLFRATFATRLAERDTDIGVIAKLLGHADLESVNRYVLIDQTKIEATIRQKGFCS